MGVQSSLVFPIDRSVSRHLLRLPVIHESWNHHRGLWHGKRSSSSLLWMPRPRMSTPSCCDVENSCRCVMLWRIKQLTHLDVLRSSLCPSSTSSGSGLNKKIVSKKRNEAKNTYPSWLLHCGRPIRKDDVKCISSLSCTIDLMSHELDHMTKAAAWAAGFGFRLLWAGPKPLLGRHQWPGLARPKQARLGPAHGFGPGQANH